MALIPLNVHLPMFCRLAVIAFAVDALRRIRNLWTEKKALRQRMIDIDHAVSVKTVQ